MTAPVMANPASIAGGDHTMFLAGDDEPAKATVRGSSSRSAGAT